MVDLFRIAGKDNLASPADAGKDGLDDVGAEILTLGPNDKLPGHASSPDVNQRFQLDRAAAQKIVNGGIGPDMLVTEKFQVVINRLHPRPDLFFLIPRQVPQVI